jgi:hypothetical protein
VLRRVALFVYELLPFVGEKQFVLPTLFIFLKKLNKMLKPSRNNYVTKIPEQIKSYVIGPISCYLKLHAMFYHHTS